MQPRKFAADARIASAVIKGWPDEPDSPLQGGGDPGADGGAAGAGVTGGAACVIEPVVSLGFENQERMSKPWPYAGMASAPTTAVTAPTCKKHLTELAISAGLGIAASIVPLVRIWGVYMFAERLTTIRIKTRQFFGAFS
jgi:hypothetical protein